jgi:hypothetical protein
LWMTAQALGVGTDAVTGYVREWWAAMVGGAGAVRAAVR